MAKGHGERTDHISWFYYISWLYLYKNINNLKYTEKKTRLLNQ